MGFGKDPVMSAPLGFRGLAAPMSLALAGTAGTPEFAISRNFGRKNGIHPRVKPKDKLS